MGENNMSFEANFEEKNIKKRRIIVLLTCIGFILALLAIGFYAAFSDAVQVNNRIEIQQDNTARVNVLVEYKIGEVSEKCELLIPGDEKSANIVRCGEYREAAVMKGDYMENKVAVEQGLDGKNHLNFSRKNGYTYGAYKVTLKNEGDCDAEYSILVLNAAAKAAFESESVGVYFVEGDKAYLSAGTSAAKEAPLKKGEKKIVYVAISSMHELDEINGKTVHGYTLKVDVREMKTEK